MAGFADLVAGAVCIQQLGDEGTFTNAGGISLNYADNMVDEAGTYATAGAGITCSRVGAGNIRIGTMVDIEEGSLCAFKQNVLPALNSSSITTPVSATYGRSSSA